MHIVEAFSKLREINPEAAAVRQYQGEDWDIDQIVPEMVSNPYLEESSDGGEWTADADGIYQIDLCGRRTGNQYTVLTD